MQVDECEATALIAAIEQANTAAGSDTIVLNPTHEPDCTFELTGVDNYWYGPNGLPPIASIGNEARGGGSSTSVALGNGSGGGMGQDHLGHSGGGFGGGDSLLPQKRGRRSR
jgi:hypothetical protein